MRGSAEIKDHIRREESFSPRPYLDPPGNRKGSYSTGFGHHILPSERAELMNATLTRDQAEQIFQRDVAAKEAAIAPYIKRPMSQGMYDGILDLAFNAGEGSAIKVIDTWNKTGDINATAEHLKQFNHADGKVLPALVKRRAYDASLFSSDSSTDPGEVPAASGLNTWAVLASVVAVTVIFYIISD